MHKLIDGNKKFIEAFQTEQELYKSLADKGQHPKVLWVGCSDSRVVPEFIVNAKVGDLFVTRNIANIIPPAEADDSCTSSVLEYAVLHLEVKHIVICGHTGCGGITAVVKGTPKDTKIHEWLKHACQSKELTIDSNRNELVLNTIKDNILLQAENLLTFDYVKERFDQGLLHIHKWLYDMNSGKISFFDDINWNPLNR
ncbi:MAG: carbonic anhydrase [Candidatus Cloacimonadales bacterium]|nr:carbonic anhydrase [Candidatus Cloacimonadales bacterium]